MALYNLSEMLTTIKENTELEDLPLPVSDKEIMDHLRRTSLTDFSLLYPRIETILLGQENLNKKSTDSKNRYYEYVIPRYVYEGSDVLSVSHIDVARPNGYSDFFIPNANWSTPDAVISAMADVRMAAGVASSLAKSPTYEFEAPDTIKVFNGWAGGIYQFEILLRHDDSLATVEPGCFTNLRELMTLDFKSYLYGLLKRKDGAEVGLGNIQLRIDDWQNCGQEYREMIKEWSDDANFNVDHIYRY